MDAFVVDARRLWHAVAAWLLNVYYVIVEPTFRKYTFFRFGLGDATYGRDKLPYSDLEKASIYANPDVDVTQRKVYFALGEPILSDTASFETIPAEHGGKVVDSFVNYYVWEMPERVAQEKRASEGVIGADNQLMQTCMWRMASMTTRYDARGRRALTRRGKQYHKRSDSCGQDSASLPSTCRRLDALRVCMRTSRPCSPMPRR